MYNAHSFLLYQLFGFTWPKAVWVYAITWCPS